MTTTTNSSQRGAGGPLAVAASMLIAGVAVLGVRAGLPGPSDPFTHHAQAAAAAATFVVPAGAHAAGAAGTNWRTDLEVHNAGATQVSYTITLLRRDQDNASAPTRGFSLSPGLSARYPDALGTLFSFSGAAALRLEASGGPLVVTSRTYNLLAAGNPLGLPIGSTFGQFVAGSVLGDAIPDGQVGRILQLSHTPNPGAGAATGFRSNLGVVNAGSAAADVVVELFTADGAKLGEVRRTLRAWEYVQWDRVFEQVTSASVGDGYAVARTTTAGGRFFAYASVVDNATGDPVFIPAIPSAAANPSPTATASPSPSPSPTSAPPTPTVPAGAVTLQPGPGGNAGADQGGASGGKDAAIYKGSPTTNYGASSVFFIDDNEGQGCYNDNSTATGLVRFDVSSLPAAAASAKVRLYCTRALPSTLGYVPVDLFRLDSDWNEMTASYTNRPTRGPLISTVNVADEPGGLGWYEWDVTALYNQWRSGAVANYGLEIHGFTCRANASHDRHFATSDFTDNTALRPMLVVIPGNASQPVNANLAPYTPSGWQGPVVPDSSPGTRATTVLSAHMNTYVDWAVANYGPADVPGRIDFSLRLDGQQVKGWYADGLKAGYYVSVDDYSIPYDTIAAGVHTLSMVADSANAWAETNESDNTWEKSWEWTTIVFAPPGGPGGSDPGSPPVRAEPESPLTSQPVASAPPVAVAAALTDSSIFVPASAHATGAGGTNWRTDLEIHNPGTGPASFTVSVLKRDTDNAAPATNSYSLAAGRSVRLADLLATEFGFTGAAALCVTPTGGSVLATSRTYNLLGAGNSFALPAGSTFGQFVPGSAATAAIGYGEEGRIVQLTHAPSPPAGTGFRTNVGVVNTTGAACEVVVTLVSGDGQHFGEVRKTLRPFEYVQWDRIFEQATTAAVGDGFAIVRTTTPGGRFFAYASVVDNATGDPVFVPAVRVAGGTVPPTPTASVSPTATVTPTVTPKPTANPGQPLGVLATVNDIFTILSNAGTGSAPTIEQTVQNLQTFGLDALITNAVQKWPTIVSKVPNGARVDFGTGTTLDDGSVLSGSATATVSGATISATKVQGTVTLASTNFAKNGAPSGLQNGTVGVNLTTDASHHVSGSLTLSGTGTSSLGPTTLSGTVQVNTALCPLYPVGGTVTVVQGGNPTTITFNSRCDGSFDVSGAALSYYGFEFWPLKCDGSASAGYRIRIGAAAEGGRLIVSPSCSGDNGPASNRLGGTVSPTAATFFFQSWHEDHFYQGTFSGTSSNGGLTYSGTVSYTVTAYNSAHDPGSGVRCQSGVYSAGGSSVLFVATGVPCL